MLLKEKHQK